MTAKSEKVWEYLKEHGQISNIKVMDITNTTCPHSLIRDLRKKYGYDSIGDVWEKKTKTERTKDGKEYKVTVRYKWYFLNKIGG